MSPEVLETYIRDYCAAQHTPEISMAWQGGEPTLLGVDYFRRVVELQKKHAGGRPVSNAIQTNGTEKGQSHTMTYFEISAWLFPWRGH